MKLLDAARIPIVLLDRRPEESADAPRAATWWASTIIAPATWPPQHLLGLGVRRVGFVRLEGQATTVKARVRGYHDALREFDAAGQRLHHAARRSLRAYRRPPASARPSSAPTIASPAT